MTNITPTAPPTLENKSKQKTKQWKEKRKYYKCKNITTKCSLYPQQKRSRKNG